MLNLIIFGLLIGIGAPAGLAIGLWLVDLIDDARTSVARWIGRRGPIPMPKWSEPPSAPTGDEITTGVSGCARCQGTHAHMVFRRFTAACGRSSHWAMCPVKGEPILLEVVPTGDDAMACCPGCGTTDPESHDLDCPTCADCGAMSGMPHHVGCPATADLAGERDAAIAREERSIAEAEGYKRLVEEMAIKEQRSAVVLIQGKHELRIFGTTPDRETAMAEAIAHWINMTKAVAEELRSQPIETYDGEARPAVSTVTASPPSCPESPANGPAGQP